MPDSAGCLTCFAPQTDTARSGRAFVVYPISDGNAGNECVTVSITDGLSMLPSDGLSFSFWYKGAGSDWSHIARVRNASLRFINLNYNDAAGPDGNLFPNQGGVLQNGASATSLSQSPDWSYISAVVLESGVYFYRNAVAVCSYSVDHASEGENIRSVCNAFLEGFAAGEEVRLFGNNEGSSEFYVDELTIGFGMTAAEVSAQYDAAVAALPEPDDPAPSGDYPSDPQFDAFAPSSAQFDTTQWGTLNAHDPSMIEEDGVYYVFSTGNNGQPGYEIRRSTDLIHWQYIGQAIDDIGGTLAQTRELLGRIYGSAPAANADLWAPDVVPAAGGGYWLYGSLTCAFGRNYSAIFLCHADSLTGPYRYVDTLVASGGNWGDTPNAIDPQIFYDAEGRMFMTYGSWYGGIRILELDPETGLRKDGFTGEEYFDVGSDLVLVQYYGNTIVDTSDAEGGVVSYHADVPVYDGWALDGYTETSWYEADRYILMASTGDLSSEYEMIQWGNDSPDGMYLSEVKTMGSFSWRKNASDTRIGYDFYVPGHNDLYTTESGVNLAVYHARTTFNVAYPHYLFVSMYALNARGQIVISPNRYAGESERAVGADEFLSVSDGMYDVVNVQRATTQPVYSSRGWQFVEGTSTDGAERGVILDGFEQIGEWAMFGKNYIEFKVGTERYSGVVLPAWIEAENRGGLTVTAVSQYGSAVFLNCSF